MHITSKGQVTISAGSLPDFYIGAHAAIEDLAHLTRDAAHYRTFFPWLEVLSPHA